MSEQTIRGDEQSAIESGFEDEEDQTFYDMCQIDLESKKEDSENDELQAQEGKNDEGPMPFIHGEISLGPDMKFGWKPELEGVLAPIPLCFNFIEHPLHIYKGHEMILYQGFRPKDSFQVHKKYSNQEDGSYEFNFPKGLNLGYGQFQSIFDDMFEMNSKDEEEPEFEGMNPLADHKDLVFDSTFESGNLDMVIKINDSEYDLFMRVDANTKGHMQWYYFMVTNTRKGQKVKFNIMNFTKTDSLYNQGLQPNMWSFKKNSPKYTGWFRGGKNVVYKFSKISRQTPAVEGQRVKRYYQLSFEYTFEYDDDQIWFAYGIPYTYSMLIQYLKSLMIEQQKLPKEKHILEEQELCKSLGGVSVPLLTITDPVKSDEKKNYIFIQSRIHPGETGSSWICHGLINFLLSKNSLAKEMRKRLIFKIIPMLNVDGVVLGNNRVTYLGKDMNRSYDNKNVKLNPIPNHVKEQLNHICKEKGKDKILAFLDLHAHSKKKSIFTLAPYYPLHSDKYLKIRVIPKLISERSDMFRFYSCKFHSEKYKESCARMTIWKEFGIYNSFTIECSVHGFLNKDRQTVVLNERRLLKFGEQLAAALLEHDMIMRKHKQHRDEIRARLAARKRKRKAQRVNIVKSPTKSPAKKAKEQKQPGQLEAANKAQFASSGSSSEMSSDMSSFSDEGDEEEQDEQDDFFYAQERLETQPHLKEDNQDDMSVNDDDQNGNFYEDDEITDEEGNRIINPTDMKLLKKYQQQSDDDDSYSDDDEDESDDGSDSDSGDSGDMSSATAKVLTPSAAQIQADLASGFSQGIKKSPSKRSLRGRSRKGIKSIKLRMSKQKRLRRRGQDKNSPSKILKKKIRTLDELLFNIKNECINEVSGEDESDNSSSSHDPDEQLEELEQSKLENKMMHVLDIFQQWKENPKQDVLKMIRKSTQNKDWDKKPEQALSEHSVDSGKKVSVKNLDLQDCLTDTVRSYEDESKSKMGIAKRQIEQRIASRTRDNGEISKLKNQQSMRKIVLSKFNQRRPSEGSLRTERDMAIVGSNAFNNARKLKMNQRKRLKSGNVGLQLALKLGKQKFEPLEQSFQNVLIGKNAAHLKKIENQSQSSMQDHGTSQLQTPSEKQKQTLNQRPPSIRQKIKRDSSVSHVSISAQMSARPKTSQDGVKSKRKQRYGYVQNQKQIRDRVQQHTYVADYEEVVKSDNPIPYSWPICNRVHEQELNYPIGTLPQKAHRKKQQQVQISPEVSIEVKGKRAVNMSVDDINMQFRTFKQAQRVVGKQQSLQQTPKKVILPLSIPSAKVIEQQDSFQQKTFSTGPQQSTQDLRDPAFEQSPFKTREQPQQKSSFCSDTNEKPHAIYTTKKPKKQPTKSFKKYLNKKERVLLNEMQELKVKAIKVPAREKVAKRLSSNNVSLVKIDGFAQTDKINSPKEITKIHMRVGSAKLIADPLPKLPQQRNLNKLSTSTPDEIKSKVMHEVRLQSPKKEEESSPDVMEKNETTTQTLIPGQDEVEDTQVLDLRPDDDVNEYSSVSGQDRSQMLLKNFSKMLQRKQMINNRKRLYDPPRHHSSRPSKKRKQPVYRKQAPSTQVRSDTSQSSSTQQNGAYQFSMNLRQIRPESQQQTGYVVRSGKAAAQMAKSIGKRSQWTQFGRIRKKKGKISHSADKPSTSLNHTHDESYSSYKTGMMKLAQKTQDIHTTGVLYSQPHVFKQHKMCMDPQSKAIGFKQHITSIAYSDREQAKGMGQMKRYTKHVKHGYKSRQGLKNDNGSSSSKGNSLTRPASPNQEHAGLSVMGSTPVTVSMNKKEVDDGGFQLNCKLIEPELKTEQKPRRQTILSVSGNKNYKQ